MEKKVLILSPFFHPEPISTGRYNRHLANALVENGLPVDVICFHPIYPDWRPQFSNAQLPGVCIERGGLWIKFPKRNFWRRVVLESAFLLHLVLYASRIKRYSHIVAVLPPMLFLPMIRLVADPNAIISAVVHDLQGVMAGIGLNQKRSKIVDLIKYLEGMVLKCCHRIIVLSNSMAATLSERYHITPTKISICWPFVTIDATDSGDWIRHLFAKHKKHVVYAGALGEKQNPDGIIAFFTELLKRRDDVVCHIFSRGPIFDRMKQNRKIDHQRLKFHDLVPEHHLVELYKRSDIQLIPQKMGFSSGAIPSKLPNLMAAAVPVLFVGEKKSDVRKIIEKTNAGVCADSWDIDKLCDLTDRLLTEGISRSREERRQIFVKRFSAIFSVDALVKQLI